MRVLHLIYGVEPNSLYAAAMAWDKSTNQIENSVWTAANERIAKYMISFAKAWNLIDRLIMAA